MFDLDRQIRLKQAQHALKQGRLDEAFAIAIVKDVRDLRGGQVLLEELVPRLLERASEHLANDRFREALVDAERAVAAGGQRREAIELRDAIESAMAKRRGQARAVHSVRGHLAAGRLETGAVRLVDAGDGESANELERELEARRRRAREALERAEEHARAGRLLEALTSARQAVKTDTALAHDCAVLPMLKDKVLEQIAGGLDSGDLSRASELCSLLRESLGETLDGLRFEEALHSCKKAGQAFQQGDLEGARILLRQLATLHPGATWVTEVCTALDAASDALRAVRGGPLGMLAARLGTPSTPAAFAETLPVAVRRDASPLLRQGTPAALAEPEHKVAATDPLLLWIDGVGTFLILANERISIGRAGSSTRPDLGLSRSDVAGHHADLVRTDGDYFIVAAQGAVAVNGSPTPRKLLQDGDSVLLGGRSTFTFRLPTNLSTTAVVTLRGNQRLNDDVGRILLFDGHFLLGSQDNCHVQAPGTREPVVVRRTNDGLVCRASQPIVIGGKLAGEDATISLGDSVQVGDLAFTLTTWNREH